MIPLYKPYMPKELPELDYLLHSGSLAYGKWGKKFEEKLSEFIGTSNVAVVNSFNSAMLVILATLDIKSGDEVIASPMSCLASNQPFATLGVKVVWADIDPNLGTLCPDSVTKKISPKTKAIFHNHYCGYPGYIDEINYIGHKHGIYVVDDAIEAFGSEYKGRKIGDIAADATVFSFQTVRLPNTIDGGAVVFKDASLFEKAKRIRDFGIRRELFRDELGEISKKCNISEPGYGATLSDINSYVGCVQMDVVDELLSIQRENARKWHKIMRTDYEGLTSVFNPAFQNPNFWIYGVLAHDKVETIKKFRELGLYASGVHLPNNYYSVFGTDKEGLPGVEQFYSQFVAVPCGWWVNI